MAAMGRREARALSMQALCQFDVQGDAFAEQLAQFLADYRAYHPESHGMLRPELLDFAGRLASGAWRERVQIDRRLASCAQNWDVERMTLVDRNILRLAVYELLQLPETPFQVVINEAVELARAFGDASSPSFVNGVLDAAWKEISAECGVSGGESV
ncbi:MAG: Transcription antitermination protein NusB [Phycisphaerae bacterium]|nr:Transcription antitermination protein NusB [Phycisphaerae bacterium]